MDKVDPELLRRDTTIYLLLTYRLCSSALLPYSYADVVEEMGANLEKIQAKCGERFDLGPVASQVVTLRASLKRLQGRITELRSSSRADDATASLINRCLKELGGAIIPVDYTVTGPFDHDLAVPIQPLPSLQDAGKLASLEVGSAEYHLLTTKLVRARNRVAFGLIQANRAVERALAALGQGV